MDVPLNGRQAGARPAGHRARTGCAAGATRPRNAAAAGARWLSLSASKNSADAKPSGSGAAKASGRSTSARLSVRRSSLPCGWRITTSSRPSTSTASPRSSRRRPGAGRRCATRASRQGLGRPCLQAHAHRLGKAQQTQTQNRLLHTNSQRQRIVVRPQAWHAAADRDAPSIRHRPRQNQNIKCRWAGQSPKAPHWLRVRADTHGHGRRSTAPARTVHRPATRPPAPAPSRPSPGRRR